MICYSPHILTKNKFRNFKNFYSYGNTRNTLFESENGSIFAFHFRFRTGWKDLEYRFHHCLSKFVRSVLVNIKTISYFFEFTWFGFWSRNYWKLVIDHDLMANLRKKSTEIWIQVVVILLHLYKITSIFGLFMIGGL